jgi:hypothetical protein
LEGAAAFGFPALDLATALDVPELDFTATFLVAGVFFGPLAFAELPFGSGGVVAADFRAAVFFAVVFLDDEPLALLLVFFFVEALLALVAIPQTPIQR